MSDSNFMSNHDNTILTFLEETKEGKYAEISKKVIEVPRTSTSRDEYVYGEEQVIFYSMSN